MKLTRRNFLAWAGLSAVGAVACEGFGIRHGEFDLQSPVSLPEDLVKGQDNWYATLCRNCSSGEGIVVRVMEGRAKKVEGNPAYPVNRGKHSASCEAGLQALYHPDRIPRPLQRNGPRGLGQFAQLSWTNALDILKQRLEERGDAMLMITEPLRGHLGTVVNRFAGALGGRHLGFESLDVNTYRSAIKNVYGQELLPDFDLENTQFLLSFGADFLSTWVSPVRWGLGYGEFRQGAGRERGVFYQVDPRFSMTAANADKWIPIQPGWEGHLALSIAQVIVEENLQATGIDVGAMLGGNAGRELLNGFRPENVVEQIGLTSEITGEDPVDFVRKLARDFATHGPSIAVAGGSAGAHTNGLFNVEAAALLNWLVGSVGSEGGIILNPTSPWEGVPATARSASLSDFERLAEQIRSGETRMLLLHNVDPVFGLPGSLNLRDAIVSAQDLYIVSFSPFVDDSTALADLLLPDRIYLEDWGDDIPDPAPGYRVAGFQQPVVNPLWDLDPRSFPDVLLSAADTMEVGQEELPWRSYQAMLRESSDALFEKGSGSIEAATAQEFWTMLLRRGGWWDENSRGPRIVRPRDGLLQEILALPTTPYFAGFSGPGTLYLVPFSHNTLQDGDNAHLPWLQATPDPVTSVTWQTWVELNDTTAARYGIREGDIVRIESSRGSVRAVAYPTPATPPGIVAVPFGGGRRYGSDWATDRPGTESSNLAEILEPTKVAGTDTLAWASTQVVISPTGDSVNISKLEGNARSVEIGLSPAEEIIKTIAPDVG
jgi:anaerobic selenocysteine-containing dehydrogenase